ncbi:MAG TPA: hypothetical protein DGG94_02580 [Micromonosporaceae bacterium]|nr:hypothetical protein [Micromonosporaceae bacterium]HCU48706.1 hypothetical protein [Micromonosporaceae bacterium]
MSTVDEGAAPAAPGPRRRGSLIAGGVLLIGGVALFLQALSAGRESGVVLGGPTLAPIIVTGIWVAVALAYFLGQLRNAQATEKVRWRTPFLLLAALIGYAVVLKYTVVGYVLSTAVFILIAARLLSTRPYREVIVRDMSVAIGLSLAIYLSFTRMLGIVLPAGVLPL